MPLAAGQVVNGRYRIIRLLGQGGMGAVYQAWDQNLERPCALKENLETSEGLSRQFEREARLLANLNHPNLPRVTDHFHIPNQGQYLVMDFIEGEDLDQRLRRAGRPLPELEALDWIAQVADALTYLHRHDPPIIHRDVKPANIRITPAGRAMLVDFGIAKMYASGSRTTQGARAVTPGFSPPEQYGAGPTDERSDIYALGATLYALLTGFTPPDSVDLMTGAAGPLHPTNRLNPAVSPQVSAAIAQAMQPGRAQRFASIDEFKTALRAATAPLPPPPGVDRLVSVANGYAAPPGGSPNAGSYPARVISAPRSRPRRRAASGWLLLAAPAAGLALVGLVAIVALVSLLRKPASPTPPAASEPARTQAVVGPIASPPVTAPPSQIPPATATPVSATPVSATPVSATPVSATPTGAGQQIPAGAVQVNLPPAWLAFVSDHESAARDQIYLIQVLGGNYWYQPDRASFFQVSGGQVQAIPAPFSALSALPALEDHNIAWWPEWCDGDSRILFEAQDTQDKDFQTIYQIPAGAADAGAAKPIKWDNFRMLGVPRCSHQGRTALLSALSRNPNTTWELYLLDLGQPDQGQRVSDGFPFAGNADWAGDDSWIVFMRRPIGTAIFSLMQLALSHPDNARNFDLWPGVSEAKYPAISAATGEIAFACADAAPDASGRRYWNLCLVDANGQNLRVLLRGLVELGTAVRSNAMPTVPAVTPRWSADGQWLAYTSNRSGNWDVYLYSPALGYSINLTGWLGGNQFEPAWSKR